MTCYNMNAPTDSPQDASALGLEGDCDTSSESRQIETNKRRRLEKQSVISSGNLREIPSVPESAYGPSSEPECPRAQRRQVKAFKTEFDALTLEIAQANRHPKPPLSITCPFCRTSRNSPIYRRLCTFTVHYLQKHAQQNPTTHETIWRCFTCSTTFSSEATFTSHVSQSVCFHPNDESSLRTSLCPHCPKGAFKRTSQLVTHLAVRHREEIEETLREKKGLPSMVMDETTEGGPFVEPDKREDYEFVMNQIIRRNQRL